VDGRNKSGHDDFQIKFNRFHADGCRLRTYQPEEVAGFKASAKDRVPATDYVWLRPTTFRMVRKGPEEPWRGTLCRQRAIGQWPLQRESVGKRRREPFLDVGALRKNHGIALGPPSR
jgi:hypothetical protein